MRSGATIIATVAAKIGWTLVLVGGFLCTPVADLLPVDFQYMIGDHFARRENHQYDKVVSGGDEKENAVAWLMLVSGAIIVIGSTIAGHFENAR